MTEGRMAVISVAPVAGHKRVCISVRSAYGGAAVSAHVPCETQARREIRPLVVNPFQTWKARIAGINETGRSVFEHAALETLFESVVVEVVDLAVRNRLGKIRLPTKAVVQSQLWCRFPGISRIDREECLPGVMDVGSTLEKVADPA